jgi:hypothetical protein
MIAMQPWKEKSVFTQFLFVNHIQASSRGSLELNAHISPLLAFIDRSTSLALLSRALISVQLLSKLVIPATYLSTATLQLQDDILVAQQDFGPCANGDQKFLMLNSIRQKSLLFPLFGYPSLLDDYCCGNKGSELYPLLYLAHLYAVGIIVELSMPEVEFPTLARGLMAPLESTQRAIISQIQRCQKADLVGIDELVAFPLFVADEFRRRGKGIRKRFI